MKDLKIDGLEVLGTEEMSKIQGGNPVVTNGIVSKAIEWGYDLYNWWNAPAHMPDITSNQA